MLDACEARPVARNGERFVDARGPSAGKLMRSADGKACRYERSNEAAPTAAGRI